MITELTDKQKNRFVEFRDKWLAIGLSTEPANKPKAEDAIRQMYVASQLKPPSQIIWCGSPRGNGLVRFILQNIQQSVWQSVRQSVEQSVYGQHDSAWLAFYDYFAEVCDLKIETEKLNGLWWLAKNAGWAVPHTNICFVSERHNVCKLENGRIHCDNGPAIAYPDGFSIYAIHGVAVPENVVMSPKSQTIQEIESESNSEVQRIRIERFGWEKYLNGVHAVIVEQRINDRDCQAERLYRMANGQQRFVCIDPSTGRQYALGVPREITNCESAQQWMSHGLDRFAIHRS